MNITVSETKVLIDVLRDHVVIPYTSVGPTDWAGQEVEITRQIDANTLGGWILDERGVPRHQTKIVLSAVTSFEVVR